MTPYHPNEVIEWAEEQLGIKFYAPWTAFAHVVDDEIRGAVVFTDYTGENIEISIVGGWSRQMFKDIAHYTLEYLGCQRVTARTRASKPKVVRVMERSGFQREGLARRYYPGGDDALLFGMLPEECRYL